MCTWIAKQWLFVFNLMISLLGALCLAFSAVVLSKAHTDFGAALIIVSSFILFVGLFGILIAPRKTVFMKIWAFLAGLMITFESVVILAFVFDKGPFLRFINRIDQNQPWSTNSTANQSRTETAALWLHDHSEQVRWPAFIFLIFEIVTMLFAICCAKRIAAREEPEDKEYLLAYSQLHDSVKSHPVTDSHRSALNEKCLCASHLLISCSCFGVFSLF